MLKNNMLKNKLKGVKYHFDFFGGGDHLIEFPLLQQITKNKKQGRKKLVRN